MKAALGLALAGWCLALAPSAWAIFVDPGSSASQSMSTGQLAAPTAPAASAGLCTPAVTDRIVISWTATSSSWASGYEILRSTTSGGPYTVAGTVSGAGTTTFTDAPLAWSTTYHYRVRAMKHQWRSSTTAQVQRTTRTILCV